MTADRDPPELPGYYRNIEKVNRMLRRALEKIPESNLSDEEISVRQSLAEEPLIAVANLIDRGIFLTKPMISIGSLC
jgi:hypothetical protein